MLRLGRVISLGLHVTFAQARRDVRVALAAALLLVLQSLAAALALGASASAAPLDLYGNPLCAPGAETSAPDHGQGHAKAPPCCTPGCPTLSGLPGTAPEGAALSAPLAAGAGAPLAPAADPLPPDRKHRPGNPRAPPLTA